jgi:trigger factor
MDFRVETIGPCRKKVTVTVPAERIREEYDKQYDEINKNLSLPGFRPGKAPRKILEARFAKKLVGEVKAKLVEAAFQEMVSEKKVQPIASPRVDVEGLAFDPAAAFEFTVEMATRPEFDLPETKGLEVTVPPLSVSDADVDAGVERLRLAEGTLVPAPDGVAAEDDVLVLDLDARRGDAPLHAESNVYYRLGRGVVEGIVAEGLDAALRGASAGAKAKTEGRVAADDPREALRGDPFDLHVEVREVKRFRLPDLDEAFLKARDYDGVDELRQDVRRKIVRARERERDRMAEDRLVDLLVERAKIPLPAEVVDGEVERWLDRRRLEASAEGMPEEEITKEAAGAKDEVRSRVERDLRRVFVLEKVAEAEKVEVGESDLVAAIEQMAREAGRPTSEVAGAFSDPQRLGELRSHVRHRKAKEALRRAASVVEETAKAAPATEAPKAKAAKAPPKKGK